VPLKQQNSTCALTRQAAVLNKWPVYGYFYFMRLRHVFLFDLVPMTLIYELDLDILKVYLHTKNELSRSRLSTVRIITLCLRQTHSVDWAMDPHKIFPEVGKLGVWVSEVTQWAPGASSPGRGTWGRNW